jgi:hypothetical protein
MLVLIKLLPTPPLPEPTDITTGIEIDLKCSF